MHIIIIKVNFTTYKRYVSCLLLQNSLLKQKVYFSKRAWSNLVLIKNTWRIDVDLTVFIWRTTIASLFYLSALNKKFKIKEFEKLKLLLVSLKIITGVLKMLN